MDMNGNQECDYIGCYNTITEKSNNLNNNSVKLCAQHEKEFDELCPEDPKDVDTMKMVSFMLNTNLANRD